jgi:hypothetical protein
MQNSDGMQKKNKNKNKCSKEARESSLNITVKGSWHKIFSLLYSRFHRGGIIQGVLFYTMPPWKTLRKSMGE